MITERDREFLICKTETMLFELGTPTHLIGFTYLTEAVVFKLTNAPSKFYQIYKAVADSHNTSQRAVTRDISYAIDQTPHLCKRLSLHEDDMFCGRIISALALKLKLSLSVYPIRGDNLS